MAHTFACSVYAVEVCLECEHVFSRSWRWLLVGVECSSVDDGWARPEHCSRQRSVEAHVWTPHQVSQLMTMSPVCGMSHSSLIIYLHNIEILKCVGMHSVVKCPSYSVIFNVLILLCHWDFVVKLCRNGLSDWARFEETDLLQLDYIRTSLGPPP